MNFNCYGYGPPDDRASGSSSIAACCSAAKRTTPGVDLIMPDIRFLEEQRASLSGHRADPCP